MTCWEQVAAGWAVAFFGVFVGFVLVSLVRGSAASVFALLVGLAGATFGLVALTGTVVASAGGLRIRWGTVRTIPWGHVDHFELIERRRWGSWSRCEVVELVLRDAERITLWPLRSGREGTDGTSDPTPANRKRAVLQRYREAYAPV